MRAAVIFGGSGFIGCHYATALLAAGAVDRVYLCDLVAPEFARFGHDCEQAYASGAITYHPCDVRKPIDLDLAGDVTLIANFAAIHREPGHEAFEYFRTNILGAENVCYWADTVNCQQLIFTSSIAPYGPADKEKTEASIPTPVTPYGSSKLVAEKIHQAWQAQNSAQRKLVIVRPGVVFGPGEGGNVTRLIKSVLGRYFFYMGNKKTHKAGTYVKELCRAMSWVLGRMDQGGISLFNMSLNPAPDIEQYVETICTTAGVKRRVLNVPFTLMYLASLIIDPIAKLFNINQPISPVRIKKLVRSNNISPRFLEDQSYDYRFSFGQAMADWHSDQPADWGG